MKLRRILPLCLLALCTAVLVFSMRHALTAEAITARSPRQRGAAIFFLLALYAIKSVTVALPISALTAAGGALFPLPAALAVNLCGTAIVQAVPFFLGRRQQSDLSALQAKHPKLGQWLPVRMERPGRTVFLLRLAGATPGDLFSLYLGAAGLPFGSYLSGGLLGAAPRVAVATVLGGAVLAADSGQLRLSLAIGAGLTALSLLLWLRQRSRYKK